MYLYFNKYGKLLFNNLKYIIYKYLFILNFNYNDKFVQFIFIFQIFLNSR